MARIAMLGSGFIGRFYADSLQGYRSRDKIVSIYSRREERRPQICGRLQGAACYHSYGGSHCASRCGYCLYFAA